MKLGDIIKSRLSERTMFGGEFTEAEVNALVRFAGTSEVTHDKGSKPRTYTALAFDSEGPDKLCIVAVRANSRKRALLAMQHELARALMHISRPLVV